MALCRHETFGQGGHIPTFSIFIYICIKFYIRQTGRSSSYLKSGIIGDRLKEHMRDFQIAKDEKRILNKRPQVYFIYNFNV